MTTQCLGFTEIKFKGVVHINVAAFDLSTTCTGVTKACIENNKIKRLATQSLYPDILQPEELGFLRTKRKVTPKRGKPFVAFVKYKDEIISKTEKDARDTLVRMEAEKLRIRSIASRINKLLLEFRPEIILLEANMAFRSMLTTKQLSELAGALEGLAVVHNSQVEKINVHSARGDLNLTAVSLEFAKGKNPEWLKRVDLTKETVKHIMLNKYSDYGLDSDMSTDESDSLLIFDAWYEGRHKNARGSLFK